MDSNPNICVVCGEHSDQVSLHYSRPLCNGCRAFFKRSVQGKVKFTECKSGKKCKVSYDSRKNCKSCRWDACVRAGVDITKVQPPKETDQTNQNNTCDESYNQQNRFFSGGFEMPLTSWGSSLMAPSLILPQAMPTTYATLQPNLSTLQPNLSTLQHNLSTPQPSALGQSPLDINLFDSRQMGIASLDRMHSADPYLNAHLSYSLGKALGPVSSGSTSTYTWLTQPSNSLSGQQIMSLYNSLHSAFTPYNAHLFTKPYDVSRHAHPDQRTSTPNSQRVESPSGSSNVRDTINPFTTRVNVSPLHSKQQTASDSFPHNDHLVKQTDHSTNQPMDNDIQNVKGEKEVSLYGNTKDVSLDDDTKDVSLNGDTKDVSLNGDTKDVSLNGDTKDVSLNGDTKDVSLNGDTKDVSLNGDTKDISLNGDTKDVSLDGDTKDVSLDGDTESLNDMKYSCQSSNNILETNNAVSNKNTFKSNETVSASNYQDTYNDHFNEVIPDAIVKRYSNVELSEKARAFMIDELLRDNETVTETSCPMESLNSYSNMSVSPGSTITGFSRIYNSITHLAPLPSVSNLLSNETARYSIHNMSELMESPIRYEASTFFNLDARITPLTPGQGLYVEGPCGHADPLPGQPSPRLTSTDCEDTRSPECFVDCENVSDEDQSDNVVAKSAAGDSNTSDRLISIGNNDPTDRLSFETIETSNQNNMDRFSYSHVTKNSYDTPLPAYRNWGMTAQSQLLSCDSGLGASANELIVSDSSACDVSENKENTRLTLHRKRPLIDSGSESTSPKRQKISSQSNTPNVHCGPGYTSTPISKMFREPR